MHLGITTLARVPLELNAKLNIIKDWLGVTSAELLNSLLREEVDRLYLEAIEAVFRGEKEHRFGVQKSSKNSLGKTSSFAGPKRPRRVGYQTYDRTRVVRFSLFQGSIYHGSRSCRNFAPGGPKTRSAVKPGSSPVCVHKARH
jgi:hypothetical protein